MEVHIDVAVRDVMVLVAAVVVRVAVVVVVVVVVVYLVIVLVGAVVMSRARLRVLLQRGIPVFHKPVGSIFGFTILGSEIFIS